MPELPEVEVTRQGLLAGISSRRVTGIISGNKRLRQPIPRKMLKSHILGNTFRTVDRRAKYLLFRMEDGSTLVIHLGMTGKLALVPDSTPPARHDHLRLRLDNTTELRLNDSRRFGSIEVWPAAEALTMETDFSRRLGVEPFSRNFSVAYLREKSRASRMPIKNFLMDSRIIAGIGNIYANEILFCASVHPEAPANALSALQWKRIISATRRILKDAIRAGGSTIADFLGSSGNPGYFQIHFKVYSRDGQPCTTCGTAISKKVLAGRATYFCPCCQKKADNA